MGRRSSSAAGRRAVALCAALVAAGGCLAWAQAPADDRAAQDAASRRLSDRMRALQREADQLALQSRTVMGDLRKLEIERDLAVQEAAGAEAAAGAARKELQEISGRLDELERQRLEGLPDLRARVVELYKRGRGRYARMLMGVRDLRELGRATRAVASLAHLNQRKFDAHHRLVEAARGERAAAERKTGELEARRAEARAARAAADRAVASRVALLAEIDRRRDLNAQLAGELLVAEQQLQQTTRSAPAEAAERVSATAPSFRAPLSWPVEGSVTARFGQPNRISGTGVRNGIEIGAAEGSPVRAAQAGVVRFADPFTGYGNLVIVDHGANRFTLYGYLAATSVRQGERIDAGSELGRVGFAPLGGPALYFEVRIDGRSVDPVQWLEPR